MAIKIKHNDPTLNSFSKNDIVINIKEGSLFYKSNTNLFRIKGDNMKTTTTESFGGELWVRSDNNLYYTSGSVGIGTTSPIYNLDVHGSPNGIIRAYGPTIGRLSLQNNTRHYSLSVQGSTLFFYDETGGATRAVINSSGNVGIGTSSPTSKLHLASDSADVTLTLEADISNDTESHNPSIKFLQDGGHAAGWLGFTGANSQWPDGTTLTGGLNNALILGLSGSASGTNEQLQFATANNVRMTITNTGNVGIGTSSPSSKLHVNGDITSTHITASGNISSSGTITAKTAIRVIDGSNLEAAFTTPGGHSGLVFNASGNNNYSRFNIANVPNSTSGDRYLDVRYNDDGTTLAIRKGGNIGIGTTSPTGGDDTTHYPSKLTAVGMISSSRGFNVASHIASGDLSVGYYTIATCFTGRAVGRFIIEDRDSSRHMGTVFYASSFFGGVNGDNKKQHINVISAGQYATQTVTKIRIKAGGVYDGKVLQVYVANATNALRVRFLGDAAQTTGWRLKNFIPDATPPPAGTLSYNGHSNVSGSSTYANITAASGSEFDLGTAGKKTGTTGDFHVGGTLSKGAGSFKIDHPDPTKTDTHYLYHNFVESPTEGDNIYRWTITTANNTHTIDLPDYYKFLNKNDMVWVNAVDHFGKAYGIINNEQTKLIITSDTDGKYNVLLIGTRKDQFIKDNYQGVEVKK